MSAVNDLLARWDHTDIDAAVEMRAALQADCCSDGCIESPADCIAFTPDDGRTVLAEVWDEGFAARDAIDKINTWQPGTTNPYRSNAVSA